jgi:hypothetical protein
MFGYEIPSPLKKLIYERLSPQLVDPIIERQLRHEVSDNEWIDPLIDS